MKDIKNKIIHLDGLFKKELPSGTDVIDNINISGYASTNATDRAGDVIPTSVWEKGIVNYLKNPIILSQHDYDEPIGRMVEHKVDSKGLWIKARISAAAEETFNLVKDGVLTAFSVGFRILDAEYNAVAELFVIKELELVEISVVSVPCNQDTLFSLSKSFDNDNEYNLFKLQFAPASESAKGLESSKVAMRKTSKEIGMDPKELQAMLDATAVNAANLATKAILDKQEADRVAATKAAAEEAEMNARIAKAVALATPTTTGTDKLVADLEKRFAEQATAQKTALEGLEAVLKEKATELEAMQKSKMTFSQNNGTAAEYKEIEKAVLLSKISGKAIADTKYGAGLIVKYTGTQPSAHLPGSTWDTQVSTNMESEIRRKLVVAPTLRNVDMQQPVMKIPVNPEAGYGTWVVGTNYGTSSSSGTAQTHGLTDITLSAYKVATKEYLAFEEDEDSLIPILPIVRDAMIRRTAKSIDLAMLRGAGTGGDPVGGLATYSAVSAGSTFVSIATGFGTTATANLRAARKALGAWGLDPSELVFVVSTDLYYALLDDTNFQTMDKVGDRATILTGQIGSVGGTPVLVSAEFPTAASGANNVLTNLAALCYAPANFIAGQQRGLRFDTQDMAEDQKKVLVASMRVGMTRLTNNLGPAVHAIRYTT